MQKMFNVELRAKSKEQRTRSKDKRQRTKNEKTTNY